MKLVLDVNMVRFAERMGITSSRLKTDYGLSTVNEIIQAEAAQGNEKALRTIKECYTSREDLITVFKLADPENKYKIISYMKDDERIKVLSMLEKEDLLYGFYFFTKETLLDMLMKVNIEEIVAVIKEAFPLCEIVKMLKEEDLKKFMNHKDLKKEIVIKQIKLLPKEFLQKFIESVTGEEQNKNFTLNFINSLYNMPEDKFKKFMTFIDPDVQRQLVFQLSKDNENYLTFFDNYTFLVMLNTLQKPDMIKPLIMLNQETMVNIIKILPPNMLAIVSSQIDTKLFASILQNGNMNILKRALTI